MPAIKFTRFDGEIPRINPRALPDFNAQVAKDCNLLHGDVRPLNSPLYNATSSKAGTIQSIYLFEGQYWFTWTEIINAVKSAIAGDTTARTYFTGATGKPPQMTNATLALTGGTSYPENSYDLGVPAPANAPTAVASSTNADAGLNDSRAYVYTYVSAYGEEGPPSAASAVIDVDTTVSGTQASLSGLSTSPAGNYNIATIRIYRTATSLGTTEYQFVDEIAVGTTTYDDAVAGSALGEVLPSETWVAPPTDMVGLIMLPNGMMAGYSGNQVCLCEPYQFHAWPISYRQAVGANIMGLIAYGSSIAILTDGTPYVMTGIYPSSMTMERSEITYACIAQRSVVDMGYYGIYAAPEGLVQVGMSGFSLATEKLFTPDQWQAFNPSSIVGFYWQGRYVGFYDATSIGGGKGGFILDPRNPAAGWTEISVHATGGFYDKASGKLYIIESTTNTIREFDGDTSTPLTFTWQSKTFALPSPLNMAMARVMADAYPVTAKVYADGALKHTETVSSSEPFTLPAGFEAREWSMELDGTNQINYAAMATSADELAQV